MNWNAGTLGAITNKRGDNSTLIVEVRVKVFIVLTDADGGDDQGQQPWT
jgi:hypothetical protein